MHLHSELEKISAIVAAIFRNTGQDAEEVAVRDTRLVRDARELGTTA